MRRMTTLRIWKKITGEDRTWVSTRDLRLLQRIARAAELTLKVDQVYTSGVTHLVGEDGIYKLRKAVEAYNAKP